MGLVIKNNLNLTQLQGSWWVTGSSYVLHIYLLALSRKSIIPASHLTWWHSKSSWEGTFLTKWLIVTIVACRALRVKCLYIGMGSTSILWIICVCETFWFLNVFWSEWCVVLEAVWLESWLSCTVGLFMSIILRNGLCFFKSYVYCMVGLHHLHQDWRQIGSLQMPWCFWGCPQACQNKAVWDHL